MAFYDGTKLLSLKDINGKTPQFYLCTTNRTGGKTTYFSRLLINRFLKTGKKFVILYRFSYELGNCGEQFFNDIHDLFFPEHQLTSLAKCKGKYYELLLDNAVCGYALAINNAEFYKRRSHLFNTVETIFFDEFQSETGKYCANEIRKFKSIIVSICRGRGKQYRYVPVYMCGNMITILNPYFTSMGIADRIRDNTIFCAVMVTFSNRVLLTLPPMRKGLLHYFQRFRTMNNLIIIAHRKLISTTTWHLSKDPKATAIILQPLCTKIKTIL